MMRNSLPSSRGDSNTIIVWKSKSFTARDCTSVWPSSANSNQNKVNFNNVSKLARFACRRCPNRDKSWQLSSNKSSVRNRLSMLLWTPRNLVTSSPRSKLSKRAFFRSTLPISKNAEKWKKNCFRLSLHTATC